MCLDRFLEVFGGPEGDLLRRLDLHRLAGLGVAPHAGCPLADLQDAKAAETDLLTFFRLLAIISIVWVSISLVWRLGSS
jgi:hypothetical protein